MTAISFGRATASSRPAFALRTTVAALAGAGLITSATVGAQEIAAADTPAAVPAQA
ncbi:MAG: hypothetical protein JWP72_1746, partial [Massilia sp.]|nr:hypothetical protein [Massilia sp.]